MCVEEIVKRIICRNSSNSRFYAFTCAVIVGGIFSILDVYTDVAVMIQWFSNADYWWASGILFFLLLSHCWSVKIMYSTLHPKHMKNGRFEPRRFEAQSAVASRPNNENKQIMIYVGGKKLMIHLFLTFIGFSQIQLIYLFNSRVNRAAKYNKNDIKTNIMRVRVGRFKFIESIFESIPNGALQIYFIYLISNGDILSIDFKNYYLTIFSIILSLISVGRGIAKWIKINVIRNIAMISFTSSSYNHAKMEKIVWIGKWHINLVSSIYYGTDYVIRILSIILLWIVCRQNVRWLFIVFMVLLVFWEMICCQFVMFFWKRGMKQNKLFFNAGLAQNLSSWIFHFIASIFTVYYYHGVRPTTIGTIIVLISRYIINITLFIIYVKYSKYGIVENWNLIYLCFIIINIIFLCIWSYIKYIAIRPLYLYTFKQRRGSNLEIGVGYGQTVKASVKQYAQTAMATEEASQENMQTVQITVKPNQNDGGDTTKNIESNMKQSIALQTVSEENGQSNVEKNNDDLTNDNNTNI